MNNLRRRLGKQKKRVSTGYRVTSITINSSCFTFSDNPKIVDFTNSEFSPKTKFTTTFSGYVYAKYDDGSEWHSAESNKTYSITFYGRCSIVNSSYLSINTNIFADGVNDTNTYGYPPGESSVSAKRFNHNSASPSFYELMAPSAATGTYTDYIIPRIRFSYEDSNGNTVNKYFNIHTKLTKPDTTAENITV